MTQDKGINMNNEYVIMNEIIDNENISQRELSRKLGVSLGSVNVLINKMINEGIIKMEQVSQKQVAYMLTPAGMVEKTKKTVSYLKGHYRVIYETKEKIKEILSELNDTYENILILIEDDEMGELVKLAATEYKTKNEKVKIVSGNYILKLDESHSAENVVLLFAVEDYELVIEKIEISEIEVVNLLEML